MSNQRKHILDNLLNEVRQLREKMKGILPSYTASLKGLSQLPKEFECRFWASCVETLLQMVRADYENFQGKAWKVDFLGKFMTVGIDVVLKAGGMGLIAPPPPVPLGIAISPSGEIKPTVLDVLFPQTNVIFVSIDRFEAIIRELKDEIMKGKTLPESEEDLPKLVYTVAMKLAKRSLES